MAFFQFGKKIDQISDFALDEIPFFSSLTPSEQRLIQKRARLVEYKRGDLVYEEGKSPEAFYIIISGRFRLFQGSLNDPGAKTLTFFHRGDHFGETSLLTGKAHSASVEAKRDGIIMRLEKDDFFKMLSEIPAVSMYMNRSLGFRLTKLEDENRHEVKIAALSANTPDENIFQIWLDLAAKLAEETKRKVLLIDLMYGSPAIFENYLHSKYLGLNLDEIDGVREDEVKKCIVHHPSDVDYLLAEYKNPEQVDDKKITALMTLVTGRYHTVLIRMHSKLNAFSFKMLKQTDSVYHYVRDESADIDQSSGAIADFFQSIGFHANDIKVLLQETKKFSADEFEEKEARLGAKIFSWVPDKGKHPERYLGVLRYIAREFSGQLLGLALGSGAAFGMAHIGVLQALEEENIIPDVISGTSIGALLGALWAAGYSAKEIGDIAKSLDSKTAFSKLVGFRDLCFPRKGFLKGNQVVRFLETYLKDKTFQDLQIPIKILAADFSTSEPILFESGKVIDAVRASISIPGIVQPYFYRKRHLIDGGIVDPLPIRILTKMGIKKIIAVNVLASPKDRVESKIMVEEKAARCMEELKKESWLRRLWGRILERISKRYAVNIFNVIMNTVQFMEYEIAEAWGKQADILIHPVVSDSHWAQFHHSDKFVKIGYEKTKAQIEDIRGLILE